MMDQQTKTLLYTHITELAPLFLELAGLTFAVISDKYISKKHRKTLPRIDAMLLILVIESYLDALISIGMPMPRVRTGLSVLGYCLRPVVILMFCGVVSPKRSHVAAWVLAGINAAVYSTALFGSNIAFKIYGENTFIRGPLGYCCFVVSIILVFYLLYLTIKEYRSYGKSQFFLPLFNVAVIIVLFVMDDRAGLVAQPVSFLCIAMVNCSLSYYIWLHLQFVKEHERDLKAEQRIQLMMSQIKPHFLYNSLGAIEELCESDPQAAKMATVKFSRYLRGNMESISAEGAIPFTDELSHVMLYLDLEKLRFEDALTVKYDISCTDFKIPPLTIEPLAENAVRHGVRQNDSGRGCVTVSTREYPDHYEILVIDDGPGFDPDSCTEDGQKHIGIKNVRDRLEKNPEAF